ncbi:AraC family transcriptional regulator [Agrobacterium sp. TS43]|nr:AraC family transcriptional regulator [Agrobacterium sp. TS45]KVK69050.1 AraC family transcriptional regulator [Agrobacterium sp. C13]KVK69660.1 AraC family transcriptional regulator [Agrobacterium sp. TS43]
MVFKDLGIVPANALRRAGLPDDLLQHPSVRLPPDEYHRLWNGMEAEAGDGLFPLRVCEAIRGEAFSPPIFAALCSPNLVTAVRRIAQYKRLIAPMRLEVSEEHDKMTLELSWICTTQPPGSLILLELLFFVSLARMGTRETVIPVAVTTPVLPSPIAPYEAFLGASLKQGARHQIVFGAADAIRPFLTSNARMWATFEPHLRQQLAELDGEVTTSQRVREALLAGIPSGRISIEAIAGKLVMSKRTLQRRIESEGASYQQLLAETRAALAHHYLRKTTLPLAEISFLLGFDEPNSFYRAFRAWTGKTPDSVRYKQ